MYEIRLHIHRRHPGGRFRTRLNSGAEALVGVTDIDEARKKVQRRVSEGCDCIESCWVFGENVVGWTIGATGGRVSVRHVMHLLEMGANYRRVSSPD